MNYADLLWGVRHRWKLVALSIAATLIAVAIWTALSPRVYSSAATLLFDDFPSEMEGGAAAPQPAAMATLLGTQADIIRSEAVASEVVRDLGWGRKVAASEADQQADRVTAYALLAGLTVTPSRNTNVMAVEYKARDPEAAALVANGFADAFVKIQLRLKTEPAKVYSDWFQDRTRDVRDRYEKAQARLTRFQQEKGLIGGEKQDLELNHLAQLSTELAGAEGAAADMRSRASSGASLAPEVQMSPAVANLRSAVAVKTAEMEQLGKTLGPNHPGMMATRAGLAALNAKLDQAIAQGAQSVQTASTAAGTREADLRQRLANQRQRVLTLSGTQDQVAILQRDVDAAKAAYDAVTQRLNGARLKAEIPQTSVRVLDRARVSSYPVSPNIALRLVLGLLLGLFVGLGLAALVERLAPRVRTPAGLEQSVGLTTLVDLAEHRQKALSYDSRGAAA